MRRMTVLIALLFVTNAYAEQSLTDSRLREFHSMKKISDVAKSFLNETEYLEAKSLIDDLSNMPFDGDLCESRCGSRSVVLMKDLSPASANLSLRAGESCKKVCKVYGLASETFLRGIEYSEQNKNKKIDQDCAGAVTSIGRNISIEKKIDSLRGSSTELTK